MTNLPFHDPQGSPLPDANDIERESASDVELKLDSPQEESPTRSPSPHIKQDIQQMRNIFIGLLIGGAVLGCVIAVGVIIFLKRTGLVDPPDPNQRQIYERLNEGDRENADN